MVAGLKAQWSVRCEARFQGETPSLDDLVARRVGALEVWRAEKDLSVSRVDLQHLIEQLHLWFEGGMFQPRQPAPGVYLEKRPASAAITEVGKI